MDNDSLETAKLTVTVSVRRGRMERWPTVRVTTEPESFGSSAAVAIRAAIPDHVANGLPVGRFVFEKTATSKWGAAKIPDDWNQHNLRQLVTAIQGAADAAFSKLRDALSAVPDDALSARIIRDLYQSMFQRMIADGTVLDARPGFGRVAACRHPAELDDIERTARDREATTVWREELAATGYRVVFVQENRTSRAYIGVVPGDWAFGNLVVERYDAAIARVHDEAFTAKAHETFLSLARTARQSQCFSDGIGRAFRFAGDPVFDAGQLVPLLRGGVGEA